MIDSPRVEIRSPLRLVELRRDVVIPFSDVAGPTIGQLFDLLNQHAIEPLGPLLFHYWRIVMPELTVGFGVPVAEDCIVPDSLTEAVLPGGRYATLTYFGPYEGLVEATATLLAFIAHSGDAPDFERRADGEHFAGRFELYPNGPDDEPDPARWETQIFIKLA